MSDEEECPECYGLGLDPGEANLLANQGREDLPFCILCGSSGMVPSETAQEYRKLRGYG